MKKILYSFLILLSTSALSNAQSYLQFSFVLLDVNQDTLSTGGLQMVSNSDSSTAGIAFYRFYSSPKIGYHNDSLYIDSAYQGDSVTFYYYDCTGWHYFDTVFVPNQLLTVTIYTGCQSVCDASFTSFVSTSKTGTFNALSYPSGYSHYWNFGNGQTAQSGSSHSIQYTTAGTYLVIHILGNASVGCYDSVGHFVTVYDSCKADFTYSMDTATTVDFYGNNTSTSINGFWYFGDGDTSGGDSVTHTYPAKANYFVSYVIEGTGCKDSIGKYISVNPTQPCDSLFSLQHVADYQKRFVRTDSSHGYSRWYVNDTFVATGHSYLYTAPQGGTYKVTLKVVDSANNVLCSRDQHYYLNFCGKPYNYGFIQGSIKFNGTTRMDYDSLKIFLISHDTALGLLTLVDSLILTNADSAYYFFTICDPTLSYHVKAALLQGSSLYSNYIPTYSDSSIYWSGAKFLLGGTSSDLGFINMVAGTNPGGPGFIGGYVTQGANKKDEPLDHIQLLLLTDLGVPVASVFTQDGGRFEFAGLAYGKYYLTVEIPGKNSATHFIILSEDNESEDNRNFEVNSTYISALTSLSRIDQAVSGIFPNPANDQFTIHWTNEADETLELAFYSLDGKLLKETILERNGENISHMYIDDLPSGLYILKITGAETSSTLRLQKN